MRPRVACGARASIGGVVKLVRVWLKSSGWALTAAIVLTVSTFPAFAASSDCVSDDEVEPTVRIAACTRMIEDTTEPADDRQTAYGKRGNALVELGDHDRAMADFDQAISLDPNQARGYNGRGWVWFSRGDYDRAIADYNTAIKLEPKKAAIYVNRGLVWKNKGDLDRAMADFDQAIRLDPKLASAYIGRGIAGAGKGDFDRAIADYSQAIALDPKDTLAYSNRGLSWAAKGNEALAIADCSHAISLSPNVGHTYGDRGLVELLFGSLAKAQADIEKAAALEPGNAYVAIWRDILERSSRDDGHLREAAKTLDMTNWPAPVVHMFLGEQTPAEVLAAAGGASMATKIGQRCEANFFVAEFNRLQGNDEGALPLYRRAASECPQDHIERHLAAARLRALDITP